MEVNSSPGLEGIESATKGDVAGAIIDFIADQVSFPEMDLRQRLTVSRGYGAAEILVSRTSELCGKELGDCGLRDDEIMVLTLARAGKVISNPDHTRKLRAGDRLLCFGKLETMRAFLPARKKRRVRRLTKRAIQQAVQEENTS